MPFNEGHQVEFLTAADMVSALFDHAFGQEEDRLEFGRTNPELLSLIEEIGEKLGQLYVQIGNTNFSGPPGGEAD